MKEVLCCVVDAGKDVSKALCVGSPLDDDLVEVVLGLELAE